MIEIVFGDSACGSLKAAQHYGKGTYYGGIGVIISHEDRSEPTEGEIEAARREAEEKELLIWERAVPMGGKAADVYGFNLMLSIGDIAENWPGIKRKQVLEHQFSVYPADVAYPLAPDMVNRAIENLKMVSERVTSGESLRIWYSDTPDEMCEFYWFMWHMNEWETHDGQVYIVKLPEWENGENGDIARKTNWGEVLPGEWHRYTALQKPVARSFIESCAVHWRALQEENAPLRAMVNGQLISAPEDFYDYYIHREVAEEGEEFLEAKVIGRILGNRRMGIGDTWIALRIEEMVRDGMLEAVSAADEDSPSYHRVLRKCADNALILTM